MGIRRISLSHPGLGRTHIPARALLGYLVLVAGALVLLSPLLWSISTSLKMPGKEMTWPPQWIPRPVNWRNYVEIWSYRPFGQYVYNSALITTLATLGSVLSSSLVAFGFARLRFWGRNFWFVVVLSTLMLPAIVTLVPTYILVVKLGWLDTFLPLIVPAWLGQGAYGQGAFYIFLLRQFFMTIPTEYDEAAHVDGASALQVYWSVVMPMARPVLVAVAIFAFLANWNDFLYPLVFLQSSDKWTLALGVRSLFATGEHGLAWGKLTTISFISVFPAIVVLIIGQKYFIKGVTMSGLAGR